MYATRSDEDKMLLLHNHPSSQMRFTKNDHDVESVFGKRYFMSI